MSIGEELQSAVLKATKDWAKVERQTIRSERAGERARDRMMRAQYREPSIKEVVFEHMERVYETVSGGKLPAIARQMFYQMRPIVLNELPDKDLDSVYFTQNLLPAFMDENAGAVTDWDVVYDARGHFTEPHTGQSVELGTLRVREYLAALSERPAKLSDPPTIPTVYPTSGPANRYRNVLFVEKEGFSELLASAQIAERFDLAIMCTKGMSSTAARTLIDDLALAQVRVLVLHDFDKAGFSIIGTLQKNTARFQFNRVVDIVDLGLRLEDVKHEGLKGEPVMLRGESPAENLMVNGATEEEIAYLTGNGTGRGQRVELNALTSPQFIAFLERKLKEHGVRKVVPDKTVLRDAYRRAYFAHEVNAEIKKVFAAVKARADKTAISKDLAKQVETYLKRHPAMSWDAVVSFLAAKEAG
jgi:hypothetical protein